MAVKIIISLFLIWNVYLYIKYRKKVPKTTKIFLLNLFDYGYTGFGLMLTYIAVIILSLIMIAIFGGDPLKI